MRDQASRTIDVFVDKIKLHAKSMPETVIPPPAAPEATNTAKSASTTAEYSWGGWAVSSFTNKLSAANGDINIATTNGVSSHPSDPTRSSSAPPTRDRHGLPVSTLAPQAIAISTATASPLARHAVLTPSLPTPASSAADEADFDAWGDDPWNDATVQEDTFFDAVNTSHPALQPVRPSTNTGASTSAGAFDDRGEPDFAGWLAAQNQSKGAKVRGIPRGTSKPVGLDAGKAGSGGRTQSTVGGSGAGLAAKKGLASKGSATAIGTTLVPAKEKSWEEDGWGDGWS